MDPFIGEIRPAAFNFAPTGWALCQGQTIPISQNTALFSLLGTTYGGNGQTTFSLPNLQGRVALHNGQGPGLSSYDLGEVNGESSIVLNAAQMPLHSHNVTGSSAGANSNSPTGRFPAVAARNCYGPNANGFMSPEAVIAQGAGQPHNNMQPYLVINYIIAMQGVFPQRN